MIKSEKEIDKEVKSNLEMARDLEKILLADKEKYSSFKRITASTYRTIKTYIDSDEKIERDEVGDLILGILVLLGNENIIKLK